MNENSNPSITFQFITTEIESKLKEYVQKQKNAEIFVACLGSIAGKKGNEIDFEIQRLLPFPNLSSTPELTVIPPENWTTILDETTKLEEMRFLGFIHSHVDAVSKRSKADTNYALVLSREHGSILMGIVGKGLTLRMYHVSEGRFTLIDGKAEHFKIKTQ